MATKKTETPALVEFETAKGTIKVPALEDVPMGIFEDVLAGQFHALADIMDDESNEIRRSLTMKQFNEFFDAWSSGSAISSGE